jgi:hypothetical protein
MKAALLVLVWAGLLAVAGGLAIHLWYEIGDVSLGVHGWLALGLGVGLTLIVGIGLMALVFYSARRGYDEGGHGSDPGRAADPERDRGDDAQR